MIMHENTKNDFKMRGIVQRAFEKLTEEEKEVFQKIISPFYWEPLENKFKYQKDQVGPNYEKQN